MLHPQKSPAGKFKNKLICKAALFKALAGTCHDGTAGALKAKIYDPCSESKKGQSFFTPSAVITVRKVCSSLKIWAYVQF